MLDFEVQRCTRRCAKTGGELKPGEDFYSVLVREGTQFVRLDYAANAWEGAPENAFGWWKSRMPDADSHRLHWAPNDVLLHYFDELEAGSGPPDERYVLALLLVRRRILRLEDTERDGDGHEIMVLYCPRTSQEYRILVAPPDDARAQEVQERLSRLLYADAA